METKRQRFEHATLKGSAIVLEVYFVKMDIGPFKNDMNCRMFCV